jgi:hypothetical protein
LSGPPGFTFEGPYLSLAAHRDGALFGYGWGIRPGPGDDRKLTVVTWPSPARPVWREIDVAALGPVHPIDFILRCVADRDVLYFQYYLHDHREEPRPLWPGPTAIARCGPDGRARKVFDIKAHYREEQAQDKDWRCGDLIRVSPAGDLFLEIQTKSHYRVDKVSFQRWWQRRRSATRSE